MAQTLLDRAKRSFIRKRYHDVITMLESEIIQYRDSFQFYYVLGLSCLYTSDIGGAQSYFQRARQIKMRDTDLLAAQAALFLRKGDMQQAVDYYLEILEYDPGNRLARRSLNFIRKKGSAEVIENLVETGKIKAFYPVVKRKQSWAPISMGLICIIVVAVASFRVIKNDASTQDQGRADLSWYALDPGEANALTETGGTYRYILTSRQILSSYNEARRYFQQWRDNAAQVEINRLLHSNASTAVKQKARLLMSWLSEPGFDTITDRYDFQTVSSDPLLYLDCWVVWKGMATNMTVTDTVTGFDLLVGYDTRNKLEGIVTVTFTKPVDVDVSRSLEVLGRVILENGRIGLTGGSMYQTGKPVGN